MEISKLSRWEAANDGLTVLWISRLYLSQVLSIAMMAFQSSAGILSGIAVKFNLTQTEERKASAYLSKRHNRLTVLKKALHGEV